MSRPAVSNDDIESSEEDDDEVEMFLRQGMGGKRQPVERQTIMTD